MRGERYHTLLASIVVLPESVLAWALSLSKSALSFLDGKGEGSSLSSSKNFLFPAAMIKKKHCFTKF